MFLEKSIIRNEFALGSRMKKYSCFLRYEKYIKGEKSICLIESDRPTKEYSRFLRNEIDIKKRNIVEKYSTKY